MNPTTSKFETVVDEHGVEWIELVSFFVPGLPAPGGSKKAFALRRSDGSLVTRPNGSPVVNVTEAGGEKTKNWRSVVALAARQAYQGGPIDTTLSLEIEFVLPRPANHFRTGKNVGQLRDDAPKFHIKKPDALKLTRSTEDALTGIIWVDDSRIADERVRKIYGATTGARITVYALIDADAREPERAKAETGGLF